MIAFLTAKSFPRKDCIFLNRQKKLFDDKFWFSTDAIAAIKNVFFTLIRRADYFGDSPWPGLLLLILLGILRWPTLNDLVEKVAENAKIGVVF